MGRLVVGSKKRASPALEIHPKPAKNAIPPDAGTCTTFDGERNVTEENHDLSGSALAASELNPSEASNHDLGDSDIDSDIDEYSDAGSSVVSLRAHLPPEMKRFRADSRTPSPPPEGIKRQRLKNSAATTGMKYTMQYLRRLPSIQAFEADETLQSMQITRKEYEVLKMIPRLTGSMLAIRDKTAWEILCDGQSLQQSIKGKSRKTSKYDNTSIDMKDLRHWENFPTRTEIKNFIKENKTLCQLFFSYLIPDGEGKLWYHDVVNESGNMPANEEISLAQNLRPFFAQLSALLKLACCGFGDSNWYGSELSQRSWIEGVVAGGKNWVTIGGGKCAMERRVGGNPEHKIPDLTAFWTNGDFSHLNAKRNTPGFPASSTACLIVGDFKMAEKFQRKMLIPKIVTGSPNWLADAQNVVYQIHDYMDMHNARYGYIITHDELIMFRRRESLQEIWGQLDFSEAVPLRAERGKINAMMVLWYFHVKYAVMDLDGGWCLPSYYHNCPEAFKKKKNIVEKAVKVFSRSK